MKILFIHQNFPGQFKHLAPALVKRGDEVVSLSMKKNAPSEWQGVRIVSYNTKRGSAKGIHPWVIDFETKVIRAEACLKAAMKMKESGFDPDVIIAHPGWGESLFLKEVWPDAKLGIYCEFFYNKTGADVGFDPEYIKPDASSTGRLKLKNLNNLLHFEVADAAISPTFWQASTFPESFRSKIDVIHDGIDTDLLKPNPNASLSIDTSDGKKVTLDKNSEVITFVNRNLEPYRGFHIFMRALPELLKRRPNARVLIVGGNDVSYGAKPQNADSWKEVMLKEMGDQISIDNWSRVHFVGSLPYPHFITLLQLSSLHVYLTYPFVLSWSLLEAMSVGCTILASDTKPLHEAIEHNQTGRLTDFFDKEALVDEICSLLDDPEACKNLSKNAREFACKNYDLKTVCLLKQLDWVDALASK